MAGAPATRNKRCVMSASTHNLPSYRRPPLVETVYSFLFDAVDELSNAHLGAFWAERKNEWPKVRHAVPIAPEREWFGETKLWNMPVMRFELSNNPAARVVMLNEAETKMVQVQQDRFTFNWLRGRAEGEYPRYEPLRVEYAELWAKWVRFVGGLGALPNVGQWEVAYLNVIQWDELKLDGTDWSQVIPALSWPIEGGVEGVALETCGRVAHWVYEMQSKAGRLHIHVEPKPGTQNDFVLRLVARGSVREGDDPLAGIDLGRRAIVQAFDKTVSPHARSVWGRL